MHHPEAFLDNLLEIIRALAQSQTQSFTRCLNLDHQFHSKMYFSIRHSFQCLRLYIFYKIYCYLEISGKADKPTLTMDTIIFRSLLKKELHQNSEEVIFSIKNEIL